jgi:hypothetical protein
MRVLAIVLSVVALQGVAAALVCKDPCVEAARQSYRECRSDAAGTFLTSRQLCRGRDLACVRACAEDDLSCIEATGLTAALQTCLGDGAAAIQTCLRRFTTQPKQRKQCVDRAQLSAFQCRNQARRSRRRDLARCAVARRRCAQPCGPNDPPPGSRLCQAQALQTKSQAVATCNQVADADKSACLGKEATCVQACRDQRSTCTTPLQTAIDAAIESCEATRRTAVATCQATTPPGAERDACIQTADSDAFVCRDDAREAQAPGLTQCTTAYVGCVRACPPA